MVTNLYAIKAAERERRGGGRKAVIERGRQIEIERGGSRAVDPHYFFADPDPAVFLPADPNQAAF